MQEDIVEMYDAGIHAEELTFDVKRQHGQRDISLIDRMGENAQDCAGRQGERIGIGKNMFAVVPFEEPGLQGR